MKGRVWSTLAMFFDVEKPETPDNSRVDHWWCVPAHLHQSTSFIERIPWKLCSHGNKREWQKDLLWSLWSKYIYKRKKYREIKAAKSLFSVVWLWQQHDDNKISQFGLYVGFSHTLKVTLENQITPIKSNQTGCRTPINSKDNDKGSRPKSVSTSVSLSLQCRCRGWMKEKQIKLQERVRGGEGKRKR